MFQLREAYVAPIRTNSQVVRVGAASETEWSGSDIFFISVIVIGVIVIAVNIGAIKRLI